MNKYVPEYPESLKRYIAYADSDEELFYKIRMTAEWDDENYILFMELLHQVINYYKPYSLVPTIVTYFLVSEIPQILGIMDQPAIYQPATMSGHQLESHKQLLDKRKNELLELQRKFASGELFNME